MGKGAKLIPFPVLPQAWQMKKSTWHSSSRARARMSPSPQVLPHTRCQLSLLTPWCTVSGTWKNTCSQLLSVISAEISQIPVQHPGFQFHWWCNFLSELDTTCYFECALWLLMPVTKSCYTRKMRYKWSLSTTKCHPYQPVAPLDLGVGSQCRLDSDTP